MAKKHLFKKIVLGLTGFLTLTGVVSLALYQPLIRPWHTRWGATDNETQMALMGDEIVAGSGVFQTTRAIDVRAPAAQVWPWLLQIGQGRGGMFSYDWLENLAGCDIHTLDRIVPELQTLKVGDRIMMGPQKGLPYYQVALLETGKALVLRSIDPATGAPGETWGFYLVSQKAQPTRLIVRHRTPPSPGATAQFVNGLFEPVVFIMEQRMLHGLRDHAENLPAAAEASR